MSSRLARTLRGAASEPGFALLIVLWVLVLLALLVSEITATGRSEAELAANLRGSAVAEAAADGAEASARFHFLEGGAGHWAADDSSHRLRMGDAQVEVVIADEDGRIDLNTAPRALLAALLHRVGVAPAAADRMAAAIVDWRSPGTVPSPGGAKVAEYRAAGMRWGPPGGPFRSRGELRLVLGMTPALVALLRPHISVFGSGEVDPAAADSIVRAALADANGGILPPWTGSEARTVRITARAMVGDGSRFVRTSVVRIDPASGESVTLAWSAGED